MPIPYRAKNPPEHFPYVTISLIAINTLVYALTADSDAAFLVVRKQVVEDWALSHDTFSLLRMFTSMFLHGGLFHLAGNMLFLWIFGASVEGRLRPVRFTALYLLSGLAGDLLHEGVIGQAAPAQFSLGASGAIMGVAGSYLYLFPYSLICLYYMFGWFYRGTWEWQARWVVLYYVGFDVLSAFLFKGEDGVGHFAHIGGFGAGLLLTFLMRAKRDTEAVSQVQARHADMKDFQLLSVGDLETLLEHPTENMELVMTYGEKAVGDPGGMRHARVLEIINRYAPTLVTQIEPNRLARVLLALPPSLGGIPSVLSLRLASRLETVISNDYAAQVYRRIYDINPSAPESETALYRLALLMERVFQNAQYACLTYQEMLRLFPHGRMSLDAQDALRRLQPSQPTQHFSVPTQP